jgi:hypothetical protein
LVIPDGDVPRRVQVEINASETAEAGMPPEVQTRFFVVSGGAVLIYGPTGKPIEGEHSRQDLAPGADPEAVARLLWQRRLSQHTGLNAPTSVLVRRAGPLVY